ncbi:hypothetical protein [uncultured Duncaniella sp.]|uniref:hypothetical protein n=1 Tax=uncultured Duncaniella sp. TaxID=2768039 RepID=UPI00272CFDDE|nr:hypothetical protein [uncultured Duncaniella sp.]
MKKGNPTFIILLAIIFIVILSALPLSEWSGGKVKDFSLISDIIKKTAEITPVTTSEQEQIDPELLKAMEEDEAHKEHNIPSVTDSVPEIPADTVIIHPAKAPREGELVIIEDYTISQTGLASLKNAIGNGRMARIAVVGDSYIEGDIFTQDLREKLQTAYGGEGVGYVSMHTDFPGFRRSVRQGGKGWKTHMANKKAARKYLDLAEQYATPTGKANSSYEGTKAFPHTGEWSRSRFLFISPENSIISVKSGKGEWSERNITASDSVQCIEIAGTTSRFELKTSSPSLIGLGVWLDGDNGISLDCMSSRGFSGITLSRINPELCRQLGSVIDYNLIILEFGINAMSSSQKNYSVYSDRMVGVINHVRQCYPRADILLMGVGDRGEKRGGVVRSMATAPAMISAQRNAARKAHCLFWDTREAMGGEDAVVEWCNAGLINKDYIHMTHKGGARLADALFNALQHSLK